MSPKLLKYLSFLCAVIVAVALVSCTSVTRMATDVASDVADDFIEDRLTEYLEPQRQKAEKLEGLLIEVHELLHALATEPQCGES